MISPIIHAMTSDLIVAASVSCAGYLAWLLLIWLWFPAELKATCEKLALDSDDRSAATANATGGEEDPPLEAESHAGSEVPKPSSAKRDSGLALLEHYSVFGVPSGSWSANVACELSFIS
mmetsp:Transcript_4321/g.7188  ORF Transcript_4321/g.7188 Transcript_4321/m.7188 type:complete len:120 (-) Transcript_4321:119-478(-)